MQNTTSHSPNQYCNAVHILVLQHSAHWYCSENTQSRASTSLGTSSLSPFCFFHVPLCFFRRILSLCFYGWILFLAIHNLSLFLKSRKSWQLSVPLHHKYFLFLSHPLSLSSSFHLCSFSYILPVTAFFCFGQLYCGSWTGFQSNRLIDMTCPD